MFISRLALVLLTLVAPGVLGARNTLYIIRNAETDTDLQLSDAGKQRASECLPQYFGDANLGLIISCQPESHSVACHSAMSTVVPLADSVGLSVDTSCDVTGNEPVSQCIRGIVSRFSAISDKSILIVWDRKYLTGLLDAFGLRNFPLQQPGAVFVLRNGIFSSQTSQTCNTLSSNNPVQVPPTLSGQASPSSVRTRKGPLITPPASTTKKVLSLDLYYTTTMMLPDPTPSTNVVLLRESKKKRRAPQKINYVKLLRQLRSIKRRS